jgi:uracil-DNA glycosylase
MTLMFKGNKVDFHISWSDFLTPDIRQDIMEIESHIKDTSFTPPSDLVFRFLKFDLLKLKVCILGQDPYPQLNAATGRAFEDKRVSSWNETGENASLRNILKLLHKHHKKSDKTSSLAQVRKEIVSDSFKIIGPDKLFDHWEKQGVLLINTALTCKIGTTEVSNSHSIFWACIANKLVKYIDSKRPECYWLLWGKQAQQYGCLLTNPDRHYSSDHQSLNSEKKGSFFSENHFGKIKEINWVNAE